MSNDGAVLYALKPIDFLLLSLWSYLGLYVFPKKLLRHLARFRER